MTVQWTFTLFSSSFTYIRRYIYLDFYTRPFIKQAFFSLSMLHFDAHFCGATFFFFDDKTLIIFRSYSLSLSLHARGITAREFIRGDEEGGGGFT